MIKIFHNSIIIILMITSFVVADDNGLKNYKNKKYEDAKAYYENIISSTEENSAAVLGLGASQYQLGDIPNAAKSFEEALKSEDTIIREKAFYNLGNSIYSQQRPKESLAFYRKALELNPNDDDAKFNYELAKYQSQQQQQQDQNQQEQNNQNQQNQDNQNNPSEQPQDTDKDEPDKQEDQDSDSSEQEQRETPKSQKQINAEAILDALKDEEQIHQKVKMAQQSGKKFEKDW